MYRKTLTGKIRFFRDNKWPITKIWEKFLFGARNEDPMMPKNEIILPHLEGGQKEGILTPETELFKVGQVGYRLLCTF